MDNVYSAYEYEEMEKLFQQQVQQIRSKLQNDHKLVIPLQCDAFLERCLRLTDGNAETAVKAVLGFQAAIKNFRTWDATFKPSEHKDHFTKGAVVPLFKRDSNGRLIILVEAGLWDPDHMTFDQVGACSWMLIDYANATLKEVQRNGYVMIWDFGVFSLKQAVATKHWRLLTFAKIIQNYVSGRMKAFHCINHPRVVNLIYKALSPFLSEKLKKRVIFHENTRSLLEHVDQSCLPSFIGGSVDPEECVDWELLAQFFNSDSYFKDMFDEGVPAK